MTGRDTVKRGETASVRVSTATSSKKTGTGGGRAPTRPEREQASPAGRERNKPGRRVTSWPADRTSVDRMSRFPPAAVRRIDVDIASGNLAPQNRSILFLHISKRKSWQSAITTPMAWLGMDHRQTAKYLHITSCYQSELVLAAYEQYFRFPRRASTAAMAGRCRRRTPTGLRSRTAAS